MTPTTVVAVAAVEVVLLVYPQEANIVQDNSEGIVHTVAFAPVVVAAVPAAA